MRLKTRHFPYPVIAEESDAYINSSFESEVEQEIQGYNIKLNLKAILKNPLLEKLLSENKVIIVHHIECPNTRFREIVKTKYSETEFLIKDYQVAGTVQVCTFLAANEHLPLYTNSLFSSDYSGFKFNIEKGCIMAIGSQTNLIIEKARDELKNTTSIFSIVRNINPTETETKVDLTKNKIVIVLPEQIYNGYFHMQKSTDIQTVMHSMIIIPALMFTLSELVAAKDQLYHYEDNRWFRSLKKACNAIGVIIDEENLANIDILKISQQLMDSPITKAMEFLTNGGEYLES